MAGSGVQPMHMRPNGSNSGSGPGAAFASAPAQLAAAIADTTLNPIDYLTNSRGATRPNAYQGADTCMSSFTIGMHPAQKASVCASMSANSLYQANVLHTNGFFNPQN